MHDGGRVTKHEVWSALWGNKGQSVQVLFYYEATVESKATLFLLTLQSFLRGIC